jgi:diguanylate cyclase (GGDEF)-like protein/PAS domain S-box-containing protein
MIMPRFISGISSKLLLLAVLNALAFGAIALISGVGFDRVKMLATQVAGSEVTGVIENAFLGREISAAFSDLDRLRHECVHKSRSPVFSKQLSEHLTGLAGKIQDQKLAAAFDVFRTSADALIIQCDLLNQHLSNHHEIDMQTASDLAQLEQAIGEALIQEVLANKTTAHLDQLMTLAAGLRETLFLVGKRTAEKLGGYIIDDRTSQRGVIWLVKDMSLRLLTLTSSTQNIAKASEELSRGLVRYRTSLEDYITLNSELQNIITQMLDAKTDVLSIIQRMDKETFSRSATVQKEISEIVRSSSFQVLGFSLLIALLFLLLISWFNRRNIREPLRDILRLIHSIKRGEATTVLVTRHDEWGVIQSSLSEMTEELHHSQAELLASQERLEMAMLGANDGLWDWNLETDDVYYSPRWKSMLGYADDELGSTLDTWASLVAPDQKDKVYEHVADYLEGRTAVYSIEFRMRHKDGGWVDILARAQLAHDANGTVSSPRRLVGTHLDITERKHAEEELRHSEEALRALIVALPDIISRFDEQGRHLYISDNISYIVPLSAEDFIGKTHRELEFQEDLCVAWEFGINQTFESGVACNIEFTLKSNLGQKIFTCSMTPDLDESGNVSTVLAVARDVTQLKEHQQRLEHIAHYDALTGLPNRILFSDRLQQSMAQTTRRGLKLAVAYIDLDGFKAINDNHGHDVGDRLLTVVAGRMKEVLRNSDTLARLGGDEFVTVLHDLPSPEYCELMLERLLKAVSEDVVDNGVVLRVSASVGVTFYPQGDDIDADQLLRQADQAMYQAKLSGKNRFNTFDMEQDRVVRVHHASIERIREGLGNQEFVLHFQPKVNMFSGAVTGVEALIRWQHPKQGLLFPGAFLPVIEDHFLMVEMGDWVLRTVLAQMRTWRLEGLVMSVSVNISALQIQQANFVQELSVLLDEYPDIPASDLELEILETSALEDVVQTSEVIQECLKLGITVALDDFGTGYSSLTYLKRLPVHTLKIDQSFVRDMLNDPDDLAILEGVLSLARAFRREALAEGVETIAHGCMLLDFGCQLAQGYAIAYPMPSQDIPAWVAGWEPPKIWLNRQAKSGDALLACVATVEHRSWIASVEAYLKDSGEAPMMECHACRFGFWLNGEGKKYYRDTAVFHKVEVLHEEVHALAKRLMSLKTKGQTVEALDGLNDLYQLKDFLLEQHEIQD